MRFIVAAVMLLAASVAAQGQENNPVRRQPSGTDDATDSIIVKWRGTEAKTASAATRNQKATTAAGVSMRKQQSLTADTDVMQMSQKLSGAALNETLQRLQNDPNVEYASPNLRRHLHATTTSDPRLVDQWYLLGDQPAATRTNSAWDTTQGSSSIVVAVLDTGVRFEHPDLSGKVLAGYDFVTDTTIANDGGGRDADASDPGDWVSTTDLQNSTFDDCSLSDSSWHGTRVSGLIGAATDNGEGVAGAAWNTLILPVRVLGKCYGVDSDIIAAMRWAAGLAVDGVPTNTTPAKIINLSLGGTGTCSTAYQNAVNDVIAQGVLVVASAGNDGGPVNSPANCDGVLGVAGLRHIGTKVGYSSLGTEVGISAPAGNCVNVAEGDTCLYSILVPIDTGLTVPEASDYSGNILDDDDADDNDADTPAPNLGTSFSAPMAAAAAALVEAVDPTLTPTKVANLLKESATTFPTSSSSTPDATTCRVPTSTADVQDEECICTTQTCGAGMLNSEAAVLAVQNPLAVFSRSGTVAVGSSISLDGSASFAPTGHTLTTYQWSVTDVDGTAPTFTTATQATTSLQINGTGSFTVRLTVTDDTNTQDTKDVSLTATAATTTPSDPTFSDSGGGGGGGGSLGWELLLLGLLAGKKRRR